MLCENTDSLNYVDHVDSSKPLVMRVNTVLKIRNKHHLRLSEVSKSVQYLNESLIAFESLTEKDSVVIVLEKLVHNTLLPYVRLKYPRIADILNYANNTINNKGKITK